MIWLLILGYLIVIPAALYVGALISRRGEAERLSLALDLHDAGYNASALALALDLQAAGQDIEALMDAVAEEVQRD